MWRPTAPRLAQGTVCSSVGQQMPSPSIMSIKVPSWCIGPPLFGVSDRLLKATDLADRRYLGCFSDSESDRDLGYKQWDGETGHTALQCVERCRQLGHKYAGLQAGDCYCGANYGTHGPAEEVACHTHCHGHGEHPCGAELVNAVYHTERLLDLTSNDDFDAVNL